MTIMEFMDVMKALFIVLLITGLLTAIDLAIRAVKAFRKRRK